MIDANDPNRCQRTIPGGPCTKEVVPGSQFCRIHAPSSSDQLKSYILTNKVIGDTASRHAGSEQIKSLRDEIAVTRAIIELRLNAIETPIELMAAAPMLNTLILSVEKLVSSCHAMEVKLGNLLDKAALLQLAQKIINIIDTSLDSSIPGRDELIEDIAKQIVKAVTSQENPK